MHAFLARVRPLSDGLVYIDPVSTTDPGFGNRPPVDPGYGRPGGGWSPVDPGFGNRPPVDPGYGHPTFPHPGNPLPVPPVDGVVTPPIVLPDRPQLPAGAGIVVPLPEGTAVPAPKEGEPAPPPGTKPYVLWYGPGTQPSVVHLSPAAAPK